MVQHVGEVDLLLLLPALLKEGGDYLHCNGLTVQVPSPDFTKATFSCRPGEKIIGNGSSYGRISDKGSPM